MPNISLWENVYATKKSQDTIPLAVFTESIILGKYRTEIEAIRNAESKEKRNELKKRLPAVTVSGVFNERNTLGLLEHSGYICIDFDDLGNELPAVREKLASDPYTYFGFASASGKGFAVIVQIEKENHEKAFEGLQKYYDLKYSLIADASCGDICRLRFVSYDPEAITGLQPKIFKEYASEGSKPKKNYAAIPCTKSDISKIVQQINNTRACIVHSYEEGIRLCASLASLGEEGRPFFHACCQNITKWPYSPEKTDRKFNNFLRTGNGSVTIGTFYHYAQRAGVNTNKEKGVAIVKACKDSKRLNKNLDDTIERLKTKKVICLGSEQENKEDKQLVEQVFKETETGQMDGIQEVEAVVKERYRSRYNEISDDVEIWDGDKPPYVVTDHTLANAYIETRMIIESARKNDVVDIVLNRCEPYNPIEEFIEKHRQHYIIEGHCDGAMKALAETLVTEADLRGDVQETNYVHLFVCKWLVGMIANIRNNSSPSPLLLALTGGKNTGKTEWFRRLLPEELKRYYTETPMLYDKDTLILTAQNILILDDELSGKSKIEERHLKEILSKRTFKLRPAYGRTCREYRRIATFCGTSNTSQILTDPTGNRRVIPVVVMDVDKTLYNSIDKIAVFMEAVRYYESGYEYLLTNEEIDYLEGQTSDCVVSSTEKELVEQYIRLPASDSDINVEYLNATGILTKCAELYGINNRMSHVKLGIELALKGFQKIQKRLHPGAPSVYVYRVKFAPATTTRPTY